MVSSLYLHCLHLYPWFSVCTIWKTLSILIQQCLFLLYIQNYQGVAIAQLMPGTGKIRQTSFAEKIQSTLYQECFHSSSALCAYSTQSQQILDFVNEKNYSIVCRVVYYYESPLVGFTSECFLVNSILQSNTHLKYSECSSLQLKQPYGLKFRMDLVQTRVFKNWRLLVQVSQLKINLNLSLIIIFLYSFIYFIIISTTFSVLL